MQETQEIWVRSLSQEDLLEEEMATHSSILAWRIPTDGGAWQAMGEKNFFSNTENLQHAAKPSRVIGNIQGTIRADYERNKTLRSVSRILGWAK